MPGKWIAAAFLCLSFASLFSWASAFEVQPMRHSLFPDAGQNTSLITVRNTRGKPLPVELVVEKRVFDEQGNQTLVPADEDFVIFPFQAVIQAGEAQAFRFQYVGPPIQEDEIAYTLNVREVPVDLEEGFSGLRYIYNFGVVVYVESSNAESQLSVNRVERDGTVLKIDLENSSSSFARLSNDRLTLTQGDTDIGLEGEALTSIVDRFVVPPHAVLPVILNIADLDLATGDISVELRETPD